MWRLGIDLGGTKTVAAVGDASGAVRARVRFATEPAGDPERDLARIFAASRAMLQEEGLAAGDLEAVGIAAPGPVQRDAGLVIEPPNLPGWERVALRDALEAEFGRPAQLENDADAAAVAEWRFGAGRGVRDVVYLTMSTGVGGGLILGGRLHRGASGNAGEIGHLTLVPDGDACACGRRGCLEAYVGGAAWARRLRETAPEDSACVALAGARGALGPEQVLAAAEQGDRFACAELDRFNRHLARGLAYVVLSFAPQRIVLGTIVRAAGDRCLVPVREQLREDLGDALTRDVEVVAGSLGPRLPELAALAAAFGWGDGAP